MTRTYRLTAALGIALVLAPWAVAQAPADQPALAPAPAAVIPPDQQPTKEQLTRLFELTRVRQQVQSVMRMMPAMIQKQMNAQAQETAAKHSGDSFTPDQQAAIAKVEDKYMEKALNIVTLDELLDDMTTIYQRHLSRSDVDAFIAFFSSPAGQHMLDAQPAIMQEYMPVVMNRVQERSKKLADEQTREMEELIKSMPPPAEKPAAK
jgi:hypothetical protein